MFKTPNLDGKSQINISVSIVGNDDIHKLNKDFRGKDYPTDVLSFNINEDDESSYYLGDIVVNKDRALKQAGDYGHSLEQEISELVAHGVLHLLGVHHDGDDH